MRRSIALILGALAALPLLARAQEQPDPERRRALMEKMMEARFHLQELFDADVERDIPVDELSLPPELVERVDPNGDGVVDFEEFGRLERQATGGPAAPRDRSDFTHLRDGGFPLNVNPEIVSAGEAGISDDDLVMGVVIRGEARAYPVNYMNGPYNEVVNDELGGEAIAPSW